MPIVTSLIMMKITKKNYKKSESDKYEEKDTKL